MTIRAHHQTGFTLLEVLVAILILSLGLLGFLGLQAKAMQFTTSAEDSNRASLLANDMAGIILTRGNGTASVPQGEIDPWAARVSTPASGGMPNGAASVATSGNKATITITWQATTAASGTSVSVNRYVTQVIVP
jgi:type IV pilus assembly protein PilV